MRAVFDLGDSTIVSIAAEDTCDWHCTDYIAKLLQYTHELFVDFITSATTTANHLRTAEVWSDHINYEPSNSHKECSSGNYKTTALQFSICFKFRSDFVD